ncbi:MAG: putative 4-hydroxybenzoate polyprenyltransferase [Bacteroidetes bacterium]|nr:putative 4-hydroxybenzoate polyprenyltransferase [Bacteroidota bacterium]
METKTNTLSKYLSLVKFSHTIFALPFAIIGYFLAITFTHAKFDLKLFAFVVLCMIFARSAAMAFNRFIDRKIDEQNARTAVREIPAGIVKPTSALIFVIANCILFITTTYFINPLCFYLSPVALLVVLGYSLTKRFTALCHLVLGLGLSLAPIGAYLSVSGKFDWLPLFFSFAVLFWVSGFDIIYALQDEDFDRSKNLKSIPVLFGKKGALLFSTILHLISAGFIIYAGIYAEFTIWYWIGAVIYCLLLFYQHTLVKSDDLSKVNLAFFTTNGIASVIFAVFVLIDLYF